MLLDLDPVMFRLGPLAVRWYGFFLAVSIGIGLYFVVKNGRRRGLDEDWLLNVSLAAVAGGIVGARLIYVLTNWPDYAANPAEIIRVDHGGLSMHGVMLGGVAGAYLASVLTRRARDFWAYADLTVPGFAAGIMLVRIGNIFNQEVLGRPTAFFFDRWPAQLVGSLVGVVVLLVHNRVARRRPPPPPGYLFWTFILVYSLVRGLVEETVRENPLYALGYVHPTWGLGFFTLTQLITPFMLALAWWGRQRALAAGGQPAGGGSGAPRDPTGPG